MAHNPNPQATYKYIEINGQQHLVTVLPAVTDENPDTITAKAKRLTFRRTIRELEEEREAGFMSYRPAETRLRIC